MVAAKTVLKRLPQPLQSAIRLAYSFVPTHVRLGKKYHQIRELIAETERWSPEQLSDWQLQRARKLIHRAATNVPFYRDLYRTHGINADDIRTWDDWRKLPTITKEDVRDNLQRFLPEGVFKDRLQYMTTGGSTALPVGFYLDQKYSDPIEWAFMYSQWDRVGYKLGINCAVFRGGFVGIEGKYWKHDPVRKETHYSSYHLTDEHLAVFLREARRWNYRYIQAYPSALTIIAKYLERTGRDGRDFFPNVQAILLGSETVYPQQRGLIERIFGARTYSWYGHAERLILAGECEHSTEYHIFPQYGVAEVVREDGKEALPGEVGELVGTGLHNDVCPLIRYRTQDLAVLAKAQPCRCERPYRRLERVEGRLQELIVSEQGRLISMTAINMHTDIFDGVKQFQFVQERQGAVELLLDADPSLPEAKVSRIRREIQEKLGNDLRLDLRLVEDIPRTGAGKHRFLVQKLNMAEYSWGDAWIGNVSAQ